MWKMVLSVFLFSVIALIIYNVLKIYVLSKVKVNKWIILVAALVVFFVPAFFPLNINPYVLMFTQSTIFVILFLWFIDLLTLSKKQKQNKINIRPKAKPNRVKNMNKKDNP